MAGNNSIQFLRSNTETIDHTETILLPGQPLFNQDENRLKIGNGFGTNDTPYLNIKYEDIIDPPCNKVYRILCSGTAGMNGGWWPFNVNFLLELPSSIQAHLITRQNLKKLIGNRRLVATGSFNINYAPLDSSSDYAALSPRMVYGISTQFVSGPYIEAMCIKLRKNATHGYLYPSPDGFTFSVEDERHTTTFTVTDLGDVLGSL